MVLIGPDPDAAGGAEAQLIAPLPRVVREGLFLAINANAFAWSDPRGASKAPARWRPGQPVDILSGAHDGRRQASPPDRAYWRFWQEPAGQIRVGQVSDTRSVRWAVAGFGPLILAGQEVPLEGQARHPRTAVGLDASGRRSVWVVVDGRHPGSSEGMSLRELAQWMLQRGCRETINLDGDGSSILIAGVRRTQPRCAIDLQAVNRDGCRCCWDFACGIEPASHHSLWLGC